MSIFHDEVEIEDFEFDEETEEYTYPCPCGDIFIITLEELQDGEDIARCPSCSLILRVIYDEDDFEYESEEELQEDVQGSITERAAPTATDELHGDTTAATGASDIGGVDGKEKAAEPQREVVQASEQARATLPASTVAAPAPAPAPESPVAAVVASMNAGGDADDAGGDIVNNSGGSGSSTPHREGSGSNAEDTAAASAPGGVLPPGVQEPSLNTASNSNNGVSGDNGAGGGGGGGGYAGDDAAVVVDAVDDGNYDTEGEIPTKSRSNNRLSAAVAE